ncbi:MAG TPA: serine protease [Verrucomicrobiae bacterium]
MNNFQSRYLLIVALFGLVGCSSPKPVWISDRERSASFAAYNTNKIDGQPIDLFLKQRTAILFSGLSGINAAAAGAQALAIKFKQEPNRSFEGGHAIAIEADGYFLTAAHCVNHSAINYLVYSDGQTAKIAIPRIVAKKQDVAIIHVDANLPKVFVWTDKNEIVAGNAVIAVGNSEITFPFRNTGFLDQICLAGKIKSVSDSTDGMKMIYSDLPGREGDSGGPLVGQDGKLLGVQSGGITDQMKVTTAVAIHPDPSWIARVIAPDRLSSLHEPQKALPIIDKNKDAPGIIVKLY